MHKHTDTFKNVKRKNLSKEKKLKTVDVLDPCFLLTATGLIQGMTVTGVLVLNDSLKLRFHSSTTKIKSEEKTSFKMGLLQ